MPALGRKLPVIAVRIRPSAAVLVCCARIAPADTINAENVRKQGERPNATPFSAYASYQAWCKSRNAEQLGRGICIVFVAGANHEAAASIAVSEIARRGFEFVDIPDGKIDELDPEGWDAFVKQAWPEFIGYFPSQSQIGG